MVGPPRRQFFDQHIAEGSLVVGEAVYPGQAKAYEGALHPQTVVTHHTGQIPAMAVAPAAAPVKGDLAARKQIVQSRRRFLG